MKKWLLIAFLALCFEGGSALNARAEIQGPIYCGGSAFTATISSATTTAIIPVPATGSARIYICGYVMTGGSTASAMTMQLEYGTGTACATGPVAITPAVSVPASNSVTDGGGTFRGLFAPAGQGLCVVTAGTTIKGAVQVYFAQQ